MLATNGLYSQVIPDEIRTDYTAVNKSLQDVLWDLSQKTKVNIAFSPQLIPADSLINVSARNKALGSILNKIFDGTDLEYTIVGNQLVIKRNEFVYSESEITIHGFVKDESSGESLPYANLYFNELDLGTESNEDGFYSLTVPNGNQRLYVSYLGYKREILDLKLKQDSTLSIYLKPEAVLNEVLILDENITQIQRELSSSENLRINQIRSLATLGGEPDVIRMAQMTAGVSSGADGLGGLNVRGGSADQNLILFDGVPVYNTGHALGVFSVFNSNLIQSAKLVKGAIPARYGGRLSSVLDIRTRTGNNRKRAGEISIGAMAAKLTLEGPIQLEKSSYLISVRRTVLDPWIKNLTEYLNDFQDKDGFASYYFYDINAKLNLELSNSHQLTANFYQGRDLFDNNVERTSTLDGFTTMELNQDNWDWGNRLASINLSSKLSKRLFSNITLYQTEFNFQSFDHQRFEEQDTFFQAAIYQSKINDLGARLTMDYMPNPKNYIKLGGGLIRHTFNPGIKTLNEGSPEIDPVDILSKEDVETLINEDEISNTEFEFFVEDEIILNSNFKCNIGLNVNQISTASSSYFSWQPRLSFLAEAEDFWVKGGVSRMNQYLHLLSSTGLGLPTDLWIPSTQNIEPESAWILSLGTGVDFQKGFLFNMEGFYKLYDNVVSFNEGGVIPINSTSEWDSTIPVGKGLAYGIEFTLEKALGQNLWNINYTWSSSNRTFNSLNNGNQFPFRFDRRHQVKFSFIRKLNENAEFSCNWLYASGNPITVPFELVEFRDENDVSRLLPIYIEKNNLTLPGYHRLDIGFNFYNDYSFGKQRFTIGLYNAYNRKNPFYIQLRRNVDRPERFEFEQSSLLPILPSISYSLSF